MKCKQQELILKNISNISNIIRRLALHCNFLSKSKSLDKEHIKKEIENIKISIESLEKYL